MILTRFAQLDNVTIGRLSYAGKDFFTVEKPWRDNRPNISSIPDGTYTMERFFDVNGYRSSKNITEDFVWQIVDVPGRSLILLHVANTANDVLGCIGLGLSVYPNLDGVGSSRNAITQFYELTSGIAREEITINTEVLK